MGYPIEVRKWAAKGPPRAYGASGPIGQAVVLATTNGGAGCLDLRGTTFGLTYASDDQGSTGLGAPPGQPQGLCGVFVEIYADGGDVGVVFGSTAASVTAGNAPSLTAAGSVTSNEYTGTAGTCHRIPSGQSERFLTQVGQDNFLAWVGAAAGFIRIHQSSIYGLDG